MWPEEEGGVDILVCIKQILDPDIPARDFRIDPERREAVRGTADLVSNIFCENALETALRLRDRSGGTITALSYGTSDAEDVLRKALAMRVDRAALVLNQGPANPDPLSVAQVLAAAANKLGSFDLVLVGRESGDWGGGQTGGLLAEELGMPFVGLGDEITPAQGDDSPGLRVRRQTDRGHEIVLATPPLVVSITNSDCNLPRIPKTRDVMKSYRKPLDTWTLDDLDLDCGGTTYHEVIELVIPEVQVECEFITGDSVAEKIATLAQRVREQMNAAGGAG